MSKLSLYLPKYETAINSFYDNVYDDLHMQDEVLRSFPPVRVSHIGTTRWLSKPDVLEAPYKHHESKAIGDIDIFTKTDSIKFKDFLYKIIKPLQEKTRKHTEEIINQTCDSTNNKIDAKNQNIWDAYIEAIEKIEMVFDRYGNPNFVIHPPKFYEKISETEPTLEQSNKVEGIFSRKKEEYLIKKQSRRLTSIRKPKKAKLNAKVDIRKLKAVLSLPRYDLAIIQLMREVKNGLENLDPILSEINRIPVVHDGITRQVSEPQILETEMKDFAKSFEIELDCIRYTDVEGFGVFLWNLSQAFIGEEKKYIFETISKTCDSTGNSFDGSDKDFWDSYLDMLENIHMRFDKDGNHNYKVYIHPSKKKEIEENPPTPEVLKKAEEIVERKRKEFYAQKRTRRLS
jgi:hypothetical protein